MPKTDNNTAPSDSIQSNWHSALLSPMPGVLLTSSIAAAAFRLHQLPVLVNFSPMILAVLMGIFIRNVIGLPPGTHSGIAFSAKKILRLGIIVLGMQLTLGQITTLGATGALIVAASLAATFLFTVWFAKVIGVEANLACMIGAGTAVCGASAAVAAHAVVGGSDDDVSYALASVTVLGTIAMFVYPSLATLLHLNAHDFGLWSGASIHEIAQVVAAAFQQGQHAGEFGTLAKLWRVTLLAPLLITLGFYLSFFGSVTKASVKPPIPWFVFGFLAVIVINSALTVSTQTRTLLMTCTSFLLSVALAGMGLDAQAKRILQKGWRPFVLAIAATLFISAFSLLLIKLFR
jgi:uncharacterized integral membrane protein (TIGR00698 family)